LYCCNMTRFALLDTVGALLSDNVGHHVTMADNLLAVIGGRALY